MSLLEWLGKDEPVSLPSRKTAPAKKPATAKKKTVSGAGKKKVAAEPESVVLGVIGTRSTMDSSDFEINIIHPVLEIWGRPSELLLPSEGESSQVALQWAQRNGVAVKFYSCDWIKQGRSAGAVRNNSIIRDATHLILLQGPRSTALMTQAQRLHGRGRAVVISERPGLAVKSPAGEICVA